jgi:transcriptional regulator of aromatic amino acid metabolism
MAAEGVEQRHDADYLSALVEALPGGVFVIDPVGMIRFATAEAASLVDRDADELVGHSVLEYVDEETAWAYAAAVALAGDFPDVVVGPMRIMVVSATGVRRSADLWASNRLDDPVLAGIVCLLTPETASLGLGEAVMAIASRAPFVTVVTRVIRAMGGHPTTARAALLSTGPTGLRLVGDTATGDLPDMSGPGPWRDAVETGVRSLAEGLEDLPDDTANEARHLGYETAWAEPIGRGGEPARGVLVLWRRSRGRPTPNELNVMHQAAALLSMAWALPDRF